MKKSPQEGHLRKKSNVSGYGGGGADAACLRPVAKEEAYRGKGPIDKKLDKLATGETYLTINNLRAGYANGNFAQFQPSHGRGQSLCLIGPMAQQINGVLSTFINIFWVQS